MNLSEGMRQARDNWRDINPKIKTVIHISTELYEQWADAATQLETENERLTDFWNELCSQMFDVGEMDYDFFITYGEKFGLLEKVEYSPEIHGDNIDADPGDMIVVNKLALKAGDDDELA